MKKSISLFIYLIIFFQSFGQYTVSFIVTDSAKKDETFLAGSFNNWNPGDTHYQLNSLDATHKSIILKNVSPGHYEFKFTRGSWATVESMSVGIDIDNRKIEVK